MNRFFNKLAVVALAAASVTTAHASHFRGGALVPSVDANGLLTVTAISFWRNNEADSGPYIDTFPVSGFGEAQPLVSGVGTMANVGVDGGGGGAARTIESNNPLIPDFVTGSAATASTTGWHQDGPGFDSRYGKVVQTYTIQLPGAGTYDIAGGSCCRVSGGINFTGSSWTMNSSIFWDGQTANTPILFDFTNIQQEVVRNADYAGNLGATAGSGVTLSYNQALNTGISSQPPGFTIDPTTGDMDIPAASTATYLDNTGGNPGADYAFSGNIIASDGSSVEFDWTFDAVDTAGNTAPVVNDVVVNALLGDTVNVTMTGTDDGQPNPTLSWQFLSFVAGGGAIAANAPTFDVNTQQFVWDTTGSTSPGQYTAFIRASDGQLTDTGTITINVSNTTPPPPPPPGVPVPGTLLLVGAGLGLAGIKFRRKRS